MIDPAIHSDSVVDAWTKFALRYPVRWARVRAVIEGPKRREVEAEMARLYVGLYREAGLSIAEIELLQRGICPGVDDVPPAFVPFLKVPRKRERTTG